MLRWISSNNETELHLSVLTVGEIESGIYRLPESAEKKRAKLLAWLHEDLMLRFHDRLLGIDAAVANRWGQVTAHAENKGRPLGAIDGLLSATALTYDFALVTRNVADFDHSDVKLVNPWQ